MREFDSFSDFYHCYLAAHENRANRRLHVAGTMSAVLVTLSFIATGDWRLLAAAPIAGYGFSWVGHFFFEKNRPAAFRHPLYSLAGDLLMTWQILTGRIRF
jgi:hypothetical protein